MSLPAAITPDRVAAPCLESNHRFGPPDPRRTVPTPVARKGRAGSKKSVIGPGSGRCARVSGPVGHRGSPVGSPVPRPRRRRRQRRRRGPRRRRRRRPRPCLSVGRHAASGRPRTASAAGAGRRSRSVRLARCGAAVLDVRPGGAGLLRVLESQVARHNGSAPTGQGGGGGCADPVVGASDYRYPTPQLIYHLAGPRRPARAGSGAHSGRLAANRRGIGTM